MVPSPQRAAPVAPRFRRRCPSPPVRRGAAPDRQREIFRARPPPQSSNGDGSTSASNSAISVDGSRPTSSAVISRPSAAINPDAISDGFIGGHDISLAPGDAACGWSLVIVQGDHTPGPIPDKLSQVFRPALDRIHPSVLMFVMDRMSLPMVAPATGLMAMCRHHCPKPRAAPAATVVEPVSATLSL